MFLNKIKNWGKITLDSAKSITIREAVPATTKQVTEIEYNWIDDGESVSANVKQIPSSSVNPIVLWDATTTPKYEDIGDWTEAQAEAKLKTALGI